VPVRVRSPRPGFAHPAGPADVIRVLTFFGSAATYGLRGIEPRQHPASGAAPAIAALRVPGIVLLFEQPTPPWVLSGRLTDVTAASEIGHHRHCARRGGSAPGPSKGPRLPLDAACRTAAAWT
jgi:hypothetical protein